MKPSKKPIYEIARDLSARRHNCWIWALFAYLGVIDAITF